MKKPFFPLFGVAMALVMVLSLGTVALASNPGAVWTTDAAGNPVNQNIFQLKTDVYLNGGPHSEGGDGLPDGDYYVKVTSPSGQILGTSLGLSNQTPVHVTDGDFDQVYQLWLIVSDGTHQYGYNDTPNNGNEYKVWISQSPTFPGGATKTDNFKVLTRGCGE